MSLAWRLLAADAFASFLESSLELLPSASSLRGRSFCRGDHRAPRLAGSSEPGVAASRRRRLRVHHGELSRALAFGLFAARPKLLPRGTSRPAAGGLRRACLAASRRGRHRVLHGELSRALTLGLFVARPRPLPRGPSRPAAGGLLRAWLSGFSPRTPSRPSWRALSSSHLRPLRCEAEASAAGAITPRGWRAHSSLV